MQEEMIDDMAEHFHQKLRKLIMDVADTCERLDIGRGDIVKLVFAGLLRELIFAGDVLELKEEDFASVCRVGYEAMKEMENAKTRSC